MRAEELTSLLRGLHQLIRGSHHLPCWAEGAKEMRGRHRGQGGRARVPGTARTCASDLNPGKEEPAGTAAGRHQERKCVSKQGFGQT